MPAATGGTLLVVLAVLAALVLFLTDPVPIDVTVIGLMGTLVILGPWTAVSPREGVSGFSDPATILAMMILSDGVRRRWGALEGGTSVDRNGPALGVALGHPGGPRWAP